MEFCDSYFKSEVRSGFFIASMMKRAWAAQMEVLSDVDKICRKHQITWFADWGTLIGAVRHKGFIPWDDDLDICMKREDYSRFIEVAQKELPEGYFVRNIHTDDTYTELFTRVINSREINFEQGFLKKFHGCPYGMGIDVFVMDYIAPSPEEEKTQYEMIAIAAGMVEALEQEALGAEEIKEQMNALERLAGAVIDRSRPLRCQLLLLMEKLFSLYTEREAEELTTMQLWMKDRKCRLPKSYYQEAVRIPFETDTIPAPVLYNAVLSKKYGNYMLQLKSGSAHEYPLYRKQEEALKQAVGINPYAYAYPEKEMLHEKGSGRKALRKQVRRFLRELKRLHAEIKSADNDMERIPGLLEQCQETAILLGTGIEEEKGEGTETVKKLEEYCEVLYGLHEAVMQKKEKETESMYLLLEEQREQTARIAGIELDLRFQAVFLPYSLSSWEYMESIWRAASQDPECKTYVIPIPYYYKKPDGSAGPLRCEAEQFPEYVPITKYDAFDYAQASPDVIYFQYPYDEYDTAMSMHPFFYSKNLKQYTEMLVYVPDFVTDEITIEHERAVENLRYCCASPGVVHADKVIVQSEGMRQVYIEILTKFAGDSTRKIWEEKVEGLGSPKSDYAPAKESEQLPEQWRFRIQNQDQSRKKVILYATEAGTLAEYGDKMLEKMRQVFSVFHEKKKDAVLLWAPDEMTQAAIETEHPLLWQKYQKVMRQFQEEQSGICIAEADLPRAVKLCDAFYGDKGHAAQMCLMENVPVMFQDIKINS